MASDEVKIWRTLGIAAAAIWLGFLAYTLLQQLSGMLTLGDFEPRLGGPIFVFTVYVWLPWLVLAPVVIALSRRLPIRPDNWVRAGLAHAGIFVVLAVAHGLVVGYYYHFFGTMSAEMAAYAPWQHSGHFLFGDDLLLFDAVIYLALVASLNIRNFHALAEQGELDAIRLSNRLTELRLETLRMQINPHFLFNTLNAIAVLVAKEETGKAAEMIRRLARFFRRSLEDTREQWVPLATELDLAGEYLAIEQARFGDRLELVERIEAEALGVPVPAMLLQPLVENAVVHGIAAKAGPCRIELSAHIEGSWLHLGIVDDGAGGDFDSTCAFHEGVGLGNVRARLAEMYGEEHAFSIRARPGHGTTIEIRLALQASAVRGVRAA